MAFDFPSSPTVGQQFTPVAGTTYVYNGYGWAAALPSPVITPRIDAISQLTISSPVANAIIALPVGYSSFDLKIVGLMMSATDGLYFQVSNDGGATYLSSGYYWGQFYGVGSAAAANAGANAVQGFITSGSIANLALQAEFTFRPGPSTTPAETGWMGRCGCVFNDGTLMNALWFGRQTTSGNRLTHIKIYPGSGNLTAGKITLLGMT